MDRFEDHGRDGFDDYTDPHYVPIAWLVLLVAAAVAAICVLEVWL